jgi:hypothetical protein
MLLREREPTGARGAGAGDEPLPRIGLHPWHGLTLATYFRLLGENGFSFSPGATPRVVVIAMTSLLNSGLNRIDSLAYRRRVAATRLEHPPIFILGHWRTGTTLLHELMVRDRRLTYPDTFQCMSPGHFLLSERVLPKLIGFLLPERRPMDNMPIDWSRPQEDEFALSNQGIPTPYWFWMYPDRPCGYDRYLDLGGLSPAELSAWKRGLTTFLKRLAARDRRQVVLKSPAHTARIAVLLELFPDAKFVHLVRDPQIMIPSTVRTWRRMSEFMGIRRGVRPDLLDYVLDTFTRLYRSFDAQRRLIPDGQFCELRYEDLVADMVGGVSQVYRQIGLEGFEALRPQIEAYMGETAGYRTNHFDPDAETRAKIAVACAGYAERYGYRVPETGKMTQARAGSETVAEPPPAVRVSNR